MLNENQIKERIEKLQELRTQSADLQKSLGKYSPKSRRMAIMAINFADIYSSVAIGELKNIVN